MIPSRLRACLVSGWLAALAGLATPAVAQDASELIVRLNRIEGQMRQLSGQVEQLGHENRTLKEQLRKFSEDVEFRFQEQKGAKPAPAAPPAAAKPERQRRSDAFDADESPASPGAPKPIGAAKPGGDGIAAILEGERGGREAQPALDTKGVAGINPDYGRAGRPAPASTASTGGGRFETAYAAFSAKRYGEAESGFRDFLRESPKDRQAADASYWLGETYLRQNKPKEAAQQFLKVTQEHGKSGRAPDAMLKLGVSLQSLGAKDQACATFAELGRKYPSASAAVKQGAEREQKKARCAA